MTTPYEKAALPLLLAQAEASGLPRWTRHDVQDWLRPLIGRPHRFNWAKWLKQLAKEGKIYYAGELHDRRGRDSLFKCQSCYSLDPAMAKTEPMEFQDFDGNGVGFDLW